MQHTVVGELQSGRGAAYAVHPFGDFGTDRARMPMPSKDAHQLSIAIRYVTHGSRLQLISFFAACGECPNGLLRTQRRLGARCCAFDEEVVPASKLVS